MKPPSGPHAVLAHYFDGPGFPPAQGSLSVDDWQRGLDAYGTRLIPAQDWIARCLAGTLENAVCVTLDDGLREAYVLARPALEQRGLTAAWNCYTGPYVGVANALESYRWLRNHGFGSVDAFYDEVESLYPDAPEDYLGDRGYLTERDRRFRYWRNELVSPEDYEGIMDDLLFRAETREPMREVWIRPDELRALRTQGHVIGIHTHSHPTTMLALSREQTALEYATSRAILAQLLFRPPMPEAITTVSHPCGSYTEYGLQWLQEHGFTLAWGATMDGTAPWTTPRWSTGYWTP